MVVNDRHPSGSSTPTVPAPDASYGFYETYEQQGAFNGYAGYDGYSTPTFDGPGDAYGGGDPLFGTLPGTYDSGQPGQSGYAWQDGTSQYDASTWDTGSPPTVGYGDYSGHQTGYDTGTAAGWADHGYPNQYATGAAIPVQSGPELSDVSYGSDAQAGGQWDVTAWGTVAQSSSGQWDTAGWQAQTDAAAGLDATAAWSSGAYAAMPVADESAATQHEQPGVYDQAAQHEPYGTGAHDASAPQPGPYHHDAEGYDTEGYAPGPYEQQTPRTYEPYEPDDSPEPGPAPHEAGARHETTGPEPDPEGADDDVISSAPVRRTASSRSRRRAPAKRSALLTVAAPSVAVLGVASIAAASVSSIGSDQDESQTTQAAPDASTVKPSAANSKLDTQLATLTADADDFADRASRTQERIDLKQRQAEERKRKAEEAARREALRPKFALPVEQPGLSAYYGQAGVNWMSVHSGIDFPVSYGTPVMAATDGTVRTQWNPAYGNMAIVTAPDGTETWYCHLSTTKIRFGSVKAGDVIAYSGNSGNSTGPHLHFEVRPSGGSAIDPLSWLRSHELDPT